jgi:hypothetical protein
MIAALLLLIAAPGARETIGVYRGWGAFRDASPPRCYAIARPRVARRRSAGFATVATWPGRGLRASLHIRLSAPRDRETRLTLSVGERRFALVGGVRDAWAADAASDRALIGAIRSGRSMSVEAVAQNGRPFADVYALAGAATAIDAATLACAAG